MQDYSHDNSLDRPRHACAAAAHEGGQLPPGFLRAPLPALDSPVWPIALVVAVSAIQLHRLSGLATRMHVKCNRCLAVQERFHGRHPRRAGESP